MAVDAEVAGNLEAVGGALAAQGAEVSPVALPWRAEMVEAWLAWWGVVLAAAFGDALDRHRDRMDPEIVALMEAGRAMRAVDFARIDQLRTEMWHGLAAVFERHDALLSPTMALPAPEKDAPADAFERVDATGRLHGLDMTAVFNMVGQCPALSVPSGMTATGLPTAAQIVTDRFDDPLALRIGRAVERARPWLTWSPATRA